jgi:diamine N-acetyltransferase
VSALPAIAIEPAREEHLAEIASLAGIIWRAHYPEIISPEQIEYMLAHMYDLDVLRRELASGIHFDRALVDGVLRGFSSYGPSGAPGEVKLHKFYVHPDWQRCGIGRALLNQCEANARGRGATSLVLNVNKRNVHAIAAYQKHGFTICESVTVDIGGGFVMDDYVMAKQL